MVLKKSKESFVKPLTEESNGEEKKNMDVDIQPVGKKSRKRQSGQNGAIESNGGAVSGNSSDETSNTEKKLSPAKKARKEQSVKPTEATTTPTTVDASTKKEKKNKKKKKNVDGKTEETVIDNQVDESGEEEETPLPGKKISNSNKSTKGTQDIKEKKKGETQSKYKDMFAEKIAPHLKVWKESRLEWKFKTQPQSWLVQHMLDVSQLPEDYFSIFLEYIAGANKTILTRVLKIANDVMEEAEKNEADLDDPKLVRARSIIQTVHID